MNERELFIGFWEREAPATLKVIERVPEEKSDYRPDPRSRNARDLAWLIVFEERALVEGLEKCRIDWIDVPAPETMKEVVDTYRREHTDLVRRLREVQAEAWEKEVPFFMAGSELMRPKGSVLAWGFLFDVIHHRGQLSTYLRPMGAKVPAIYGPSADEA